VESIDVTPDFLRGLADVQGQAADKISGTAAATHKLAGFGGTVEGSHGAVCAGSWPGLKLAVAARTNAVDQLASVSRQLAERLLIGLDDYTATDDQSSDVMDKQVRP
jgi:hypothetical protein